METVQLRRGGAFFCSSHVLALMCGCSARLEVEKTIARLRLELNYIEVRIEGAPFLLAV